MGINIHAAFDNLTMRLAGDRQEIAEAQKLRYEHLLLEFNKDRLDITTDSSIQDIYCDHIVVIDETNGKIVGTYRLLSSDKAREYNIPFCSEDEFDLSKISARNNVLEIGRAVVHRDYRNAGVFKLLWKGIMEYCQQCGIEYIFGTASYHGQNSCEYKNSFSNLYYTSKADEDFDCPALAPSFELCLLPMGQIDAKLARAETPSLIRAYIAIGALVASRGYVDRTFNCMDLLIILDFKNLNKPIMKRMFGIDL